MVLENFLIFPVISLKNCHQMLIKTLIILRCDGLVMRGVLLTVKEKVWESGDLLEVNFFKELLKGIRFMEKGCFKEIVVRGLLENGKIIDWF